MQLFRRFPHNSYSLENNSGRASVLIKIEVSVQLVTFSNTGPTIAHKIFGTNSGFHVK